MNKITLFFLMNIFCFKTFAVPDQANGESNIIRPEINNASQDAKHNNFTQEEKINIFLKVIRKLREDKELIDNKIDIQLNRNEIINNNKLNLKAALFSKKQNIKEKVLDIITDMTWIEEFNFSDNPLDYLPTSIGKLTQLTNLDLSNNNIKLLPADIGKLTQLRRLNLSTNRITKLPAEIGSLTHLTWLHLSHNLLTKLPAEIGNLTHLTWLHLFSNRLIELPTEIGKLTQLTNLDLHENQLTFLPDDIENLIQLTNLDINNNRLTSLPTNIGKLERLTQFELIQNQLTFLPSSIGDIQGLNILTLALNPILLPQGHSAAEWGKQELRARFGDRVLLDQPIIKAMPASAKKEDVQQRLDKARLRVNRALLTNQKLPDIKVDHIFSGQEMLDALTSIIADLNFFEPNEKAYLSYEVLANDFASDARNQNMSNFDKVFRFLLPRLTGYIRTLYDLPLKENDVAGWKMYQAQIPETQKMLTFVLQKIQKQADPDTKMLLFYQLINGLLHCPTGQTEGINSVVYALLENSYKISDFKTDLKHYLALKKNDAFGMAILSRGGDNSQNVHLISSYRNQLKDELGLSAAINSYEERIGIMGQDPFSGNKWNVVHVFYALVSPARLIDWVMSKTETHQDRQDDFDLNHLRNKNLPAEEHEKETLKLRTQTRLNHQLRNFTVGKISEYLNSEGLISSDEDDERWRIYFTADPLFDDFALLTRDGAKQILIHMGFLIDETKRIHNANNNNNNNFDNKDVITD